MDADAVCWVEDNVAVERFVTQLLPNNGSESTWAANANGAINDLNDPSQCYRSACGTRLTLAVLPQSGSKRTFTRSRLGAQIDPNWTYEFRA
jgi:hypothetical protein